MANWSKTAGNLYGTTDLGGGSSACQGVIPNGCGTVFRIDPAGKETILHEFGLTDGAYPYAGLLGPGDVYTLRNHGIRRRARTGIHDQPLSILDPAIKNAGIGWFETRLFRQRARGAFFDVRAQVSR